ncbi:MAG: ASKHA domain-containing protein [Clostridia bacterium]|nr:ASKHA domain-containing protein [Clostridia bacterium]
MAGDSSDKRAEDVLCVSLSAKYEGVTVAEALRLSGVDIDLPCGGNGRCGKCEAAVVFADGSEKVLRLCREEVTSGMVSVKLPSRMILGSSQILTNAEKKGKNDNAGLGSGEAFLAVDIGTTTVEAALCEKTGGSVLMPFAVLNPQKKYGADVISRIAFSKTDGGLERLTGDIRQCINDMLKKSREAFPELDVREVYVAGNTTMQHLFLGVSPAGMGTYPFKPEFTETKRVAGMDLGIDAENVTLLPSADAFIGADVVAGAAAVIKNDDGPAFFIDLGTNGEMVLKANGRYYATSSAAGPCFEGANISCGTGGIPGAISGVEKTSGGIKLSTIWDREPVGICGSGLISLISMLLGDDIIDETGLMDEDYEIDGLLSAGGREAFTKTGLSLTRKDVREFQLAKAAIRTGIEILLEKAGVRADEVLRVYTAGGLGSYIRERDAVATGIFPPEFENKMTVFPSTSLKGAIAAGKDRGFIGDCEALASEIDSFSLNDAKDFNARFVDNMYFE